MPKLTVKRLVEQSHENSAGHGFWDSPENLETIPSKLMLIVSELGEALESYRDPASDQMVNVPADLLLQLISPVIAHADMTPIEREESNKYSDALMEGSTLFQKWKAKPKGFDTELADAFIRLADLCGARGIDIETAIQEKHEYNLSRPHRHNRLV